MNLGVMVMIGGRCLGLFHSLALLFQENLCLMICNYFVLQVLSRQIAELGIYPAVDPLDSTSRMLDPRVIGDEHYETARATQKLLQDYKGLQVRGVFGCRRTFLSFTC